MCLLFCFFSFHLPPTFGHGYNNPGGIIYTASATFYDTGGEKRNYHSNEFTQTTFCPDDDVEIIVANFSAFDLGETTLENCTAALQVYDGKNAQDCFLKEFTGTTIPEPIASESGCLTFVFTTHGGNTAPGWAADITSEAIFFIDVTSSNDAQYLIEDVFISGGCFEVNNITLSGENGQSGYFTNGSPSIGLEEGIVLTTGALTNVGNLPSTFLDTDHSFFPTHEPELGSLVSAFIYDPVILEFDFIPQSNAVSFNYVFASEEYPEYVCSQYNDVFGFFISGPGFTGNQNIALIPGTTTAVAINTVNSGTPGTAGGGGGCLPGGLDNDAFYIGNTNLGIAYDGFTVPLKAEVAVVPCETYHIKLAIADGGDYLYDSAVFLEANSFDAGGQSAVSALSNTGSSNVTIESCPGAYFLFERLETDDLSEDLVIEIIVSGTATEGDDYDPLPTSVIIPAGETEFTLPVTVIADGIPEGEESIILELEIACQCDNPFAELLINDGEPLEVMGEPVNICTGGSIDIGPVATGGAPDFLYEWDNGETSPTITVSADDGPQAYSVTVTDGCGGSGEAVIPVDISEILVDIDPLAEVDCSGASGSIEAAHTGGTDPVSYEWNTGDSDPLLDGIDAGTYTVTVTDAAGCTGTQEITLEAAQAVDVLINFWTDPLCFGDATGEAVAFAFGGSGNFTYEWSSGGTDQTEVGLTAGDYTVTATDDFGCEGVGEVTITDPPELIATTAAIDPSCAGIADGEAAVLAQGGTGTYSYEWPSGSTINVENGLEAGTYIVTVTDDNNCETTGEVTLEEPEEIIATASVISEPSCLGGDGEVEVIASGGTNDFDYEWSSGGAGEIESGLDEGIYTVTVTDSNNCETTAEVTLSPPLEVTAVIDDFVDPSCAGNADGEATVTADGGDGNFNYEWSSGGTSDVETDLEGGTYLVTVTDGNNCSAIAEIILVELPDILAEINDFIAPVCFEDNSGEATVIASGGDGDFIYDWSSGGVVETEQNLSAGTYTVTVTDGNNCTATAEITFDEPEELLAIAFVNTEPTCAGGDGEVEVIAEGGDGNYSYEWSSGGTENIASGLDGGTYFITVTDGNDCEAIADVTLSPPGEIMAMVDDFINPLCTGESNGEATVSASGGDGNFLYEWPSGNTDPTETDLEAGTYMVTITDGNDCVTTVTVMLEAPLELYAEAFVLTEPSCTGGDGEAVLFVEGGDENYSYEWSSGGTSDTEAGLDGGTYYITVTDGNGCLTETEVTLTAPSEITASIDDFFNPLCFESNDGEVTVTADGGDGDFVYEWSSGGTSETETDLGSGTYTVTVTDGNDCSVTAEVVLEEPEELFIDVYDVIQPSCDSNEDGIVFTESFGGTPDYTYEWSDGSTETDLFDVGAGTYTLTVTDANDCTAEVEVTLEAPDMLMVEVTSMMEPFCNGDDDGFIKVTGVDGTPDYAYEWSSGDTGDSINDVPAGVYTVTVTDNGGCMATLDVELFDPDPVEAEIVEIVNPSCLGEANGSATVEGISGTGSFTYEWPDGNTDPTATDLAAGDYTVTIYDENDCFTTIDISLEEAGEMTVSIIDFMAPLCYEGEDGTATALAEGGDGDYTYEWSNGDDGETATNLEAGIHTVTVTDGSGCNNTAEVEIFDPEEVLVAIFDAFPPTCFEYADGSLTADAFGGDGNFTYEWSDGSTEITATNLPAGDYTVTVTDGNDCTGMIEYTLEEPEELEVNIVSIVEPGCGAPNEGLIIIEGVGGTGTFFYEWSTGSTEDGIYDLEAGTYNYTVTDGNGCSVEDAITLAGQDALTAEITDFSDPTCAGQADGFATITVNNDTGAVGYGWSDGGAGDTRNDLAFGSYTITVSDENDCPVILTLELTEPTTMEATIDNAENPLCAGDENGFLSVFVVGGDGDYTYEWSSGDTDDAAFDLGAGTYTVTITDGAGCSITTSETLDAPDLVEVAIVDIVDPSCFGEEDGAAVAQASGGTGGLSFEWSNGETLASINSLPGGPIGVTVTDDAGCSATDEVTLNIPEEIVLTATNLVAPQCENDDGGMATIEVSGGSEPYSFTWSNGGSNSTEADLSAGNYTVTVSDANACIATTSFVLENPEAITATIDNTTDPSCSGNSDGSATVSANGGTPPYTYSWTSGDNNATATGLPAGPYTVTVTDANNCTTLATTSLFDPPAIQAAINLFVNPTCNAASDGEATVTVNGGIAPYSYNWSGGQSMEMATGLAAGTYSVVVSDAAGCSTTAEVTLTEPNALFANIVNANDATCNGFNNGSATVEATGGDNNYNYIWSNGSTTTSANNLTAGTYTVTVTDGNNCIATTTAIITEPDLLELTLDNSSDVLCNGEANGSATVSASGGITDYSYSWPDGSDTASQNNLAAGTYVVSATDANACVATLEITIAEPSALQVACTEIQGATTPGGTDGIGGVTVEGGTAPYTIDWQGLNGNGSIPNVGTGTEEIPDLGAGNYTVMIADANGCETTCTFTITDPLCTMTATAMPQDLVSCFGVCDGTILLNIENGTAPFTYNWDTAFDDPAAPSGVCAGSYTVEIIDANGCQATTSVTMPEPAELTLSCAELEPVSEIGGSDGAGNITINGGTMPYVINWDNGSGIQVLDPAQNGINSIAGLTAGDYFITVTDANDCTNTCTFTITEPDCAMIVDILLVNNVSCAAACDGAMNVVVTNGVEPYIFDWSISGTTGGMPAALCAGGYTVTVTDANGCTGMANLFLPEPPALAINCTQVEAVSQQNGSDGVAGVNITGGTAPYIIAWDNGEINPAPEGDNLIAALAAGTYNITITDANGCVQNCVVTISQPDCNMTLELTQMGFVTCNGTCDAALQLDIINGAMPYNIAWSNPAWNGQEAPTDVCAGDYSVTVTDNNGCEASATYTVLEPDALQLNCEELAAVSVPNGSDGVVGVTISGGEAPYIIDWSGESTEGQIDPAQTGTNEINNLTSGSYSITVTDANNCQQFCLIVINEPNCNMSVVPTITAEISCAAVCDGALTLTIENGQEPYNYEWSNPALSGDNPTGLCAGDYAVTVTDVNNCVASANIVLGEPDPITLLCSEQSPVSAPGGGDGVGVVAVSGGTAPYTIAWSGGDLSADAAGQYEILDLASGTYNITVTDVNSCVEICDFTINEPGCEMTVSLEEIAGINCNSECTAAIGITISNGAMPYSYEWNVADLNDPENPSELCAGTYALTVTDGNGCVAENEIIISEPNALEMTCSESAPVSQPDGNDGVGEVIIAGETSDYVINWQSEDGLLNGTIDPAVAGANLIEELSGGVYLVTVTDSNGCEAVCDFNITTPNCAFTLELNQVDFIDCAGNCNASITTILQNGTPPYDFAWNNGIGNEDTPTDLCAGLYAVVVTDANGCVANGEIEILEPDLLAIACNNIDDVSNPGGSDGSGSFTPAGGTLPYIINWTDGGQIFETINADVAEEIVVENLPAGNYCATITDANNCMAECCFVINAPNCMLEATINQTSEILCYNSCDASLEVTVNNGNAPFTYEWNDPNIGDTANPTGLCAGEYTVAVTDANDCGATASFTITQPDELLLNCMTLNDVSVPGGADGAGTVSPVGGTVPYLISWSGDNGSLGTIDEVMPGENAISDLAAGNYCATITDANNCIAECCFAISAPDCELTVVASQTLEINCYEDCTAALALTINNGQAPYNFVWDNSDIGNVQNPENLCAGDYAVTVTDVNICVATTTITIEEPALLELNCATISDVTNPGGSNGSGGYMPVGGTAPYTIVWTNSAGQSDTIPVTDTTAIVLENLSAGEYCATLTDANACAADCCFTISEPACALEAEILLTSEILCYNDCSATLELALNNGNPPYSFDWNDDSLDGIQNPENLCLGTYAVFVTDADGCTANASIMITEPTLLELSCAVQANVSTPGGSDGIGEITIAGGTIDYIVAWPDGSFDEVGAGTSSIGNLAAGQHCVTVTDANGCAADCCFTVTEPGCTLVAELNLAMPVSCNGACDAALDLSFTGAFGDVNFDWSNDTLDGQSAPENLCAGLYEVTLTDFAGCSTNASFTIEELPAVSVTVTPDAASLCPGESVTITASGQGGTSNFSYNWNTPAGTQTAASFETDLAGMYLVTVTDDAGCTAADSIEVIVFDNIEITFMPNPPNFCPGESVMLSTTVSGGDGNFMYSWDTPTGTASSETLDANIAGEYSLTVTDGNNCTEVTNIIVSESPAAEAFAGETMEITCENETVTLDGAGSNGGTFLWSGPGITSDNEGLQTPTVDQGGEYILTVTNAFGCTATDMVTITTDTNLPTAIVGENQSLTCSVDCVTLQGSSPNTDVLFNWTGPNGYTSSETYPTVCLPGTYSLTVFDPTNDCTSPPALVEVADETGPPLLAVDQSGDILNCYAQSVTLDGSNSATGVNIFYEWQDDTGEILTTNADYVVVEEGTYTFIVTNVNTDCESSETFFIGDFENYPGAIVDLPDVLTCNNPTEEILVTSPFANQNLVYGWTTDDGNILTEQTDSEILVDEPGFYYVSVQDTTNGCISFDTTFVEQNIIPPLADAGSDSMLDCFDGQVTLDGSNSSTENVTFQWSGAGIVSDPILTNVTVNAPGTYALEVTNLENGCSSVDEAEVLPQGLPQLNVVDTEPNCYGEANGILNVENSSGGTPPYFYALNDGPFVELTQFEDLASGAYTIAVLDAAGCENSISLFLDQPAPLDIDAGEDVTIGLGDSTLLEALVYTPLGDGNYDLAWSPFNDLSCDTCYQTFASPINSTFYTATLTDTSGCSVSDEVRIILDKNLDVYIPNAFSPNEDGINDLLFIQTGGTVVNVNAFLIFDRWGETMFEGYNFKPDIPAWGWDGTLKGKPMNPGVFVYWAEVTYLDGTTGFFEGDVTLVRQVEFIIV